jgi:hypothetical protein
MKDLGVDQNLQKKLVNWVSSVFDDLVCGGNHL